MPLRDSGSNLLDVGRTAGVFGVKGWLKICSYTEPKENIVNYSPWWLKTRHGAKPFEVDDFKFRDKDLVVHLKGVDDRDLAAQYNLTDIAIERNQLPKLGDGDFYWHQLLGLAVVTGGAGKGILLGEVEKLIETGANDVLVVRPSADSIDDRERLLPYVPDVYVLSVDLEKEQIRVEWDPDF